MRVVLFAGFCIVHSLFRTYLAPHSKKLITLSPAGYKGFYVSGVITYIKEHYDLDDAIFSGASAGAYNALLLSFKGNPRDIIESVEPQMRDVSLKQIQQKIKEYILFHYKDNDFELEKLHIGVTTLKRGHIQKTVHSHFTSLEDALDTCIASSHIPGLTGNILHFCRDDVNRHQFLPCFDGGFLSYPYLEGMSPVIHITPSMWLKRTNGFHLEDYTTLFSRDKYDFAKLFEQGYLDTKRNRRELDKIFTRLSLEEK